MNREASGEARRRAREVALQVLFALDVQERKKQARPPACEAFEGVASHFEMPEAARAFAKELAVEVSGRREELDAHIRACARNWRIERMAVVDRNLLRLATWELAHTGTPTAVVLDEAVRMARRFGDDPSPGFVNGVLDGVARRVREAVS